MNTKKLAEKNRLDIKKLKERSGNAEFEEVLKELKKEITTIKRNLTILKNSVNNN